MSNFYSVKLSDIAEIVTGSTPSASEPDSWGDYLDFITPSDQSSTSRDAHPERQLSQVGAHRLQKRIVPAGATNLTCIGSTIGKVSMATNKCVTNQQINTLIAIPSMSDPQYLYYMVSNWSWTLKQDAAGSATPIINKSLLSDYEFRIPHLHQQHAIAEVLGAIDDKIAANTKMAMATDDYLAAKFTSVSTEVTDSIRLGDVAGVNSRTVKPYSSSSLRYIDIASVGVGTFEFPDLSAWDGAPSRARRGVRKGDTLWSTVRPNRRSHALNLSEDPALVASTGLAVLSPRDVGFAYLYEATKTAEFTSYLEHVAEGSAYPAVRADRFAEAEIVWPGKAVRSEFESLAAPLREHAHSLTTESKTLAATRDMLLPQLMSGKLRVKDAESLVSAAV